ncbi:hypothetical protein BDL97_13G058500 [Sphagnum fallax]|nr:hypothetical protein BDL97_13G058500 [Sphagnum fallax]
MQSGTSGASSVFVYVWGRGDLGQLGVGDDNNHNSPTLVATLANKKIVHVAAGDYHTAFLTNEGEVYTTGSNDLGQLGAKGRESQVSPVRVAALDTHTIIHIACGLAHTVAVTDTGALASWGDAEFGQLGVKEAGSVVGGMQPRIVKGSRESHFSHVAAGGYHTLALTGSGDVYSFGQGSSGALGHGDTESCVTPILVEALWGLGVVQVACGETHSSALTVDGQVFTWGRGKYGQLGHGSTQNEAFPVSVTALTDQMIVQIICGGDHTMAINGDGVLFSWGQGHWGQTGVDSKEDVLAPKQVTALEGKRVKQGSAGARHSIVLTDDGEIYGWGDNEQGQLGELASETQLSPVLLWGFEDGKRPLFVVAGGEHTVAVFDMVPGNYSISGRESLREGMPMELDDDETLGKAERIGFGNGLKPLALPSLVDLVQNAKVSPRGLPHLAHALEDTFSSVKFLTLAFKRQHRNGEMRGAAGEEMDGPGLDIEMVRNIYQGILELYNPEVLQTLGEAMVRLFQGIEQNMDHVPETRWTRVLLIGLQSPLIGERGLGDLISARLFAVFVRMSLTAERKIGRWLRTYPQDIFGGRFVRGVQRYISNRGTHLLSGRGGISPDVFAAIKVLLLLFEVDKKECLIPYSEFYNNAISEHASLESTWYWS